MAKSFEMDLTAFEKVLKAIPDAVDRGAKQGLDDIKDDWVRQARDVAPLDTGNLRRQVDGEVDDLSVIVTANATNKRFNYGYYIHEKDAGGRQLRTSGTVKKFLDQPAEQSEAKWQRWLIEEIQDELKKAGW